MDGSGRAAVVVALALATVVAGCGALPGGGPTPTPSAGGDVSVRVENRVQPMDASVALSVRLTDGDGATAWNVSETLVAVEHVENSLVIHRDGTFVLAVSVANSTRRYRWNTSDCRHFRVRATVAPNGSASQRQFCGEAWLREG